MKTKTEMFNVLGIDPGLGGAFFWLSTDNRFAFAEMPLKNKEIDFRGVQRLLKLYPVDHVFLERAMPLAMGSKHAFNYGRGFANLEIALEFCNWPYTLVEPAKWAKVMHEGISKDLKPKAKSLIAAERLFPKVFKSLPRTKTEKIHEGILDGLLIAGFGLRHLNQVNTHEW